MNICVNCGHDWTQHYADHGKWRCRWDRGPIGARERCGCAELKHGADETDTTEEQFDQMWPKAQVVEVTSSTKPPVVVLEQNLTNARAALGIYGQKDIHRACGYVYGSEGCLSVCDREAYLANGADV